jgi:hypothetical protein
VRWLPSLRVLAAAFAGAVASLGAQGGQPPPAVPRTDSTRADSAAVRVLRDSVKTPYAVGVAPTFASAGRGPHWGRDEIFQMGAMNVAELIERIPGARILRTGLALAPQSITWWGETGRVRVFLDGIELDRMDPREGTVRDLGAISVYQFEEVSAEPTPAELRVYLRTWRVAKTAPETRVDVLTGDQETNVYRGFYGRRFQSGLGLQFAFQHLGTVFQGVGGDGDALGLFARLGWARDAWSVDFVSQRDRRARSATLREDAPGSVPAFTGSVAQSYFRVAYRSPEGDAPWAQLILSSASFHESTPRQQLGSDYGTVPADTADTVATRPQYVLAMGAKLLGATASAAARYRTSGSKGTLSPSIRVAWERGRSALYASVDRSSEDSLMRTDVGVRVQALPRLTLSAQVSRRSPFDGKPGGAAMFERVEGLVRLGRAVLRGGVVRRDSVDDAAPIVFARDIASAPLRAATGETFGVSLPIYRALGLDVQGTQWNEATVYRPQNEVFARLGFETEWRRRFPRGDFTIRASVMLQHWGGMLVPLSTGVQILPAATPFSSMLEIRILSATITWQFRNFLGTQFETVPGYFMPRRVNLYGVRWNFSN